MTINTILAAGVARGLSMNDAKLMTMGMWIDYIVEWNSLNGEFETENRVAVQADFDAF